MAKDDRDDIDKLFDAMEKDDSKAAARAGRVIARRFLHALERIAAALEERNEQA